MKVPGYEIERPLGEGAFCEVFLAREAGGLGRLVALKVFREGERGQEAWRRELESLRQVEELRRRERVVGLVQSLGSGDAGERPWIAFEYLEAGSLLDHVKREGHLSLAAAVDCVSQAGRALAVLHGAGLFHRDVKPANILLGADGVVRLADFGLSRPLDGTLSAAGSPAFAAPEVIAGHPADGQRLDVYSLASTLAYLLTGQTMLPGRPDVFALERCGVPRPVQQVIAAATAADPAERPGDVESFLAALESASADEGAPDPAAERERAREISELIENYAYAAAAVTLLPLPGTELIGVLPLHVAMVSEIGRRYGAEVGPQQANRLLARIGAAAGLSLIGSKVAATAVKILLPVGGAVVSAPFIYASTLALGTAAKAHFEHGELSDEELRELVKETMARAKGAFDPRRVKDAEAQDMARQAVVEESSEWVEPAGASDPLARLERLAGLLEKGLIDRAEFDATKARILGEL